jgi:hypothetical protein
MTISGRIKWDLPQEGRFSGGILVFHFFGDDPGPDPSRHAIAVWVSRGSRSRAETGEYTFRADSKGGTDTSFRMKVRNFQIERGEGERRFKEAIGRRAVYVKLWLENLGAEPKMLAREVHTDPAAGWF